MKYQALAAIAAIGIAVSGCASVVKGSHQSVAITTPPTEGATCKLTNGRGSWEVTSPGAVTVDRSKTDMQVLCTKPGWNDASATIPSNFEGWTVGNILIGGVIGIGIDAATGAMNNYPNAFQVPMTPVGTAAAPAAAEPAPAAPAPTTDPGSGPGS
jgi:hypothetical protein